jgi:hypothetical protein
VAIGSQAFLDFPISGIPKKISSKNGVFFAAQKPPFKHHIFAPNHHTKTTISPSQNNHFFPTPLKKASKNTRKSPHRTAKKKCQNQN